MLEAVRKDFAVLDEQIESIELQISKYMNEVSTFDEVPIQMWRSISNAKKSTDKLRLKFDKEWLGEKRYPVSSVLNRLNNYAIREAQKVDLKISLINRGNGSVPQPIMESIFKIYLILIQDSISRCKNEPPLERRRTSRFLTHTISFAINEVNDDLVRFSFIDDGPLTNNRSKGILRNIRKIVASCTGRCSLEDAGDYGLSFKAELPAPSSRIVSQVYTLDNIKFAIHSGAVVRVMPVDFSLIDGKTRCYFYKNELIPLCTIRLDEGVTDITRSEIEALRSARVSSVSIVSVADVKFALISNSYPFEAKVRECESKDLLKDSSWFKNLGVMNNINQHEIVPLIYGSEFFEIYRM